MNKYLLFFILPLTLLAGCKSGPPADSRPVVTVSIMPYQWFVEQLAGDRFRINVLVPPGVSHHNYDPSPKQLQELESSRVLFINGQLGFELVWLPKLKSNYKNLAISDLSAGIPLISEEGEAGELHAETETDGHEHHDHGGVDPHYWMSVKCAHTFASTMAQALILADPSCRTLVEGNLAKLGTRLDSVDALINRVTVQLQHRDFFIFHPALTYFANDYGLTQHSMELAGKEPTASHFRELVDLSKKTRINTIFIQLEYDQENAQTLARETRSQIVTIDPLSANWIGEMEGLAAKMAAMDQR